MKLSDKEVKIIKAGLLCLVGVALSTAGDIDPDIIANKAEVITDALISKADIANIETE